MMRDHHAETSLIHSPRWLAGIAGSALGLCLGLGMAGCESGPQILTSDGETLTTQAFVGSVPATQGEAPKVQAAGPVGIANQSTPSPVVDLGMAPAKGGDVAATPSVPSSSTPLAPPRPALVTQVGSPPAPVAGAPTVESVLVESLVGQINGRPVYASEILEPLDGRLRQAGIQSKTLAVWRRESAQAIVQQLRTTIEDELVLAEARRSLTPEQKQGLFRFLGQIQQNLISGQRGSEIAADESLRESTGQGLRERAQSELDRALIVKELRERVGSRIVVSWRDIQQAYENDFDKFNPPAVALVRLISVENRNPSAIEKVKADLGSGTPFIEVAKSDANGYLRSEGGKLERKFSGSYAEGEFSPIPELNAAIRGLNVGQMAGPIVFNPRPVDPEKKDTAPAPDPATFRTGWVYLERIDRPDGVSLYDAQLDINSALTNVRTNEEVSRYIDGLRKRGNISRVEVMAERLMTIATDRYAPRFKNAKE
ncbi:MAG: hypothetical protein K2Q20_06690 [Phycisphaerales bacterium]|nr:hypothetical protein [Phycisphaerales bacterium]